MIPFIEVPGNAVNTSPLQIGATALNEGMILFVTVILMFTVAVAHCPAAGVKVYTVVPIAEVLMVAGLQVPVIPLFDVNGNDGAAAFKQIGLICVNSAVI